MENNVINWCEKHNKEKRINKLDGGFFCRECSYEDFCEMQKAHKKGDLFRFCLSCNVLFKVPKRRSCCEKFCEKCKKEKKKVEGDSSRI